MQGKGARKFFKQNKTIPWPGSKEQNNFICTYLEFVINNPINSLVVHMNLNSVLSVLIQSENHVFLMEQLQRIAVL